MLHSSTITSAWSARYKSKSSFCHLSKPDSEQAGFRVHRFRHVRHAAEKEVASRIDDALGISARAQQTGYFLGLPRLCGFTGTSFVLGVPSSGLERLWPGTLTGFAPGLAIISSECLNASTIPASQQSGNVGACLQNRAIMGRFPGNALGIGLSSRVQVAVQLW